MEGPKKVQSHLVGERGWSELRVPPQSPRSAISWTLLGTLQLPGILAFRGSVGGKACIVGSTGMGLGTKDSGHGKVVTRTG